MQIKNLWFMDCIYAQAIRVLVTLQIHKSWVYDKTDRSPFSASSSPTHRPSWMLLSPTWLWWTTGWASCLLSSLLLLSPTHTPIRLHRFRWGGFAFVHSGQVILSTSCSCTAVTQIFKFKLFLLMFPRIPWSSAVARTSIVQPLCPPRTSTLSTATAIEPQDRSMVKCKLPYHIYC